MNKALLILVGVIHLWFFIFEMFLWKSQLAMEFLKATSEQLEATYVLAQNQGLYNAIIGLGILLSLKLKEQKSAQQVQLYLLGSVIVAGLYGAWSTQNLSILFVQVLPATAALVVLLNVINKRS